MSVSAKFAPSRNAFKAYDIRGRVPQELNNELAFRLGAAFAQVLHPRTVAVGRDIRLSSPELSQAVVAGLVAAGIEVVDIGMCGTEEIYYAVGNHDLDGGIMVTASHNPADYNGIKMVTHGSRPVGMSNGLAEIRDLVLSDWEPTPSATPGSSRECKIHSEFASFVVSRVDTESIGNRPGSAEAASNTSTAASIQSYVAHHSRPLRVVCNPGNGGAGLVLQRLMSLIDVEMIMIDDEPDGSFPHGVPNPLLPERRETTTRAVREYQADLGAAWDGDFDRCFFFDENGRFIEGYYLVALFAQQFLRRFPGASIIHDPRLTWNTRDTVARCGGRAVLCKTGHAFIKERMRAEDAVYGGEMSAHHYFRDFFYCDSGILPWLHMLELLGTSSQPLSALVDDMMRRYPVSGEINRRLDEDTATVLQRVSQAATERFGVPCATDSTDGLSLEFPTLRFNLRASNTEPLLRLNVETRGDATLLHDATTFLLQCIGGREA